MHKLESAALRLLLSKVRRREFLKTAGVGFAAAAAFIKAPRLLAQTAGPSVWAYPDRYSFWPGDSLNVHVASYDASAQIRVRIYKLTQWQFVQGAYMSGWSGNPQIQTALVSVTAAPAHGPASGGASYEDWNWPAISPISLSSLAPGFYIAEVGSYASSDTAATPTSKSSIPFVIKNASPSGDAVLYKLNLNTLHAYNTVEPDPNATLSYTNSLYANRYSASVIDEHGATKSGYKVTMRRPIALSTTQDGAIVFDYPLVRWLERNGYPVDFCTDVDVHLDSSLSLLSSYPVVLSTGHDEYWSRQLRANLESYVQRGGNLAVLSGNTASWRITYGNPDAGGVPTAFVCDKDPHYDDVDGHDSWWNSAEDDPRHPEESLLGGATRNAAHRYDGRIGPLIQNMQPSTGGYRVQNVDHWVFAGTSLAAGHVVGTGDVLDQYGAPATENLIGWEMNGARINSATRDDGSYVLTPKTGTIATPDNLALLGVSVTEPTVLTGDANASTSWLRFTREADASLPASVYAATMGYHSSYGGVFSGATILWAPVLNEWDADSGSWRNSRQWPAGSSEATPPAVLGNPHIGRITKNVIDAFRNRKRDVVAFAAFSSVHTLLMQSQATGDPSYWRMNGAVRDASGSFSTAFEHNPGPRLRVVSSANLTGGTDVVLQDQIDGHLEYWTLTYSATAGTISSSYGHALCGWWADPNWALRAVMNLAPDQLFVFQHKTNGTLYYWRMSGLTLTAYGDFNPAWGGDPNWHPVGSLSTSGTADNILLFQNQTDGSIYYWTVNSDATVTGGAAIGWAPGTVWRACAVADFGSGRHDLLFQKQDDGSLYRWVLGGSPLSVTSGGEVSGSPWFLPS